MKSVIKKAILAFGIIASAAGFAGFNQYKLQRAYDQEIKDVEGICGGNCYYYTEDLKREVDRLTNGGLSSPNTSEGLYEGIYKARDQCIDSCVDYYGGIEDRFESADFSGKRCLMKCAYERKENIEECFEGITQRIRGDDKYCLTSANSFFGECNERCE